MESSQITIYVAIPMPSINLFGGHEKSRTTLYAMMDELCELSGELDVDLFEHGVVSPTIELLQEDYQEFQQLEECFRPNIVQECEVMRFSADVPFSRKVTITPSQGQFDLRDINRWLIRASFEKRITDLLVMANISRVGSIELKDSVTIQDGTLVPYSGLPKMDAWPLQMAVELAESLEWPKLRVMNIAEVWSWAHKNRRFLDGFDDSPMGRAIGAYSRLLEQGKGDRAMQLLWAMVGIEALYVKGKVSVMEQVREKIQAFLGRQETHKKMIGEMYDFRSRFVHGDLDFPGLSYYRDATPDFERYEDDQIKAVTTAVAILAATLQEIIARGWVGLDFSYAVSNPEHI